ncbi:hypothetical protein [Fibrobacter sp. UWB11]|uniref:hypothetical protein n=1 Tax=Fibrobacter sp. UWB11 TaxID=1896202 RepID=UPI00158824CC|nr:hypothetical protein [Fibrobacter sp. UWB11]
MIMFTYKIAKMGAAVAMLGLGLLAACSGSDVASSYSETQTGKPVIMPGTPIAELDTAYIRKVIDEGHGGCGSLAKSAADVEPEVIADADSVVEKKPIGYARFTCKAYDDIQLYMNARVQVVDSAGNPVQGATVYEGACSYNNKACQYTTDKDGYIYMDSVNFLTYLETESKKVENRYYPSYKTLQLRVLSADSSLGTNIYSSFSKATVVEVNGEAVAELEKIVLEPVYTAKVYLDSLHRLSGNFGICLEMKYGTSSLYDGEKRPRTFSPCQIVTDEDNEKGYVIIYGMPEGTYEISLGETQNGVSAGGLFPLLVVTKP